MTGSKLGAGLVLLCVSTATSLFFLMATFNGSHGRRFYPLKFVKNPHGYLLVLWIFFIYEEYYDHVIIVNLSLLLSYEKKIG